MSTKRYEGIQLLKAWMHNVLRCQREEQKMNKATGAPLVRPDGRLRKDSMDHATEAVALAYREHANARTMTGWLGRDYLGWFLGVAERNARDHRDALVRFGWMVDTGRRVHYSDRKSSTVYRFEIPRCECGAHDSWVMAAETADDRLQRAAAVVQGHVRGDGTRPRYRDDDTVSVDGSHPRGDHPSVDVSQPSVDVSQPSVDVSQPSVDDCHAADGRGVQPRPTAWVCTADRVATRASAREPGPNDESAMTAPAEGGAVSATDDDADRRTQDSTQGSTQGSTPDTTPDGEATSDATAPAGGGAVVDDEETTRMHCFECGALSAAPVCADCDADTQAGGCRPDRTPGGGRSAATAGHDPQGPARRRAADAVLALLRTRHPGLVAEPQVNAAIRKVDEFVYLGEVVDEVGRSGLARREPDPQGGWLYGLRVAEPDASVEDDELPPDL